MSGEEVKLLLREWRKDHYRLERLSSPSTPMVFLPKTIFVTEECYRGLQDHLDSVQSDLGETSKGDPGQPMFRRIPIEVGDTEKMAGNFPSSLNESSNGNGQMNGTQ